jgi:hypothetical protein
MFEKSIGNQKYVYICILNTHIMIPLKNITETLTYNITETLTYKLVKEEAMQLSCKLQNVIYVIQSNNTLYISSSNNGIVLCAFEFGNEITLY